MGRFYRNFNNRCVSLFKYQEGKVFTARASKAEPARNDRRALGDLHVNRQGVQEGNRQSLQLRADRRSIPERALAATNYFRKICRTLDDEVEYLTRYLEASCPRALSTEISSPTICSFRGEKLTAMLDFDAACRGKFIFDIATAVNSLCFVDSVYSLDRFRYLLSATNPYGAVAGRMGRVPERTAIFLVRFTVTRLHDFFLQPVAATRRVDKDFREFSIACACSAATRGRDGTVADGDGDRIRLPQVSQKSKLPSAASVSPGRHVCRGIAHVLSDVLYYDPR